MSKYPLIENTDDFVKHYEELKIRFKAMQPEVEVIVRDPEMDVEGYVVVWNTGISENGPLHKCGKGGTRITPDLELEDIKRLSCSMAEKK